MEYLLTLSTSELMFTIEVLPKIVKAEGILTYIKIMKISLPLMVDVHRLLIKTPMKRFKAY